MGYDRVRRRDPAVADALDGERQRQNDTLAMIASENHVSQAVMEAQSSELTNNYAEGYPGGRYYGGCEYADDVEQLAIDRAKELWGAEHVNVQPHSGSQANMGVYLAMLEPGDRILSLDLTHGGHLSHGHPANFAGQVYDVSQYHVDPDTGYVDYEAMREKAEEVEPDVIVSGFSAYPRDVDWERFQAAADAVGAYHVADIAHTTGLVAAGVHSSPVGTADFVTGSTHKTIRSGRGGIIMCDEEHADDIDSAVFPGTQGGPLLHNIAGKAVGFGEALEDAGIVLNANTVPGESRSAFNPSGIRAGTPALTTRGFDEAACREVADLIVEVVDDPETEAVRERVRDRVDELTDRYPLYDGSER